MKITDLTERDEATTVVSPQEKVFGVTLTDTAHLPCPPKTEHRNVRPNRAAKQGQGSQTKRWSYPDGSPKMIPRRGGHSHGVNSGEIRKSQWASELGEKGPSQRVGGLHDITGKNPIHTAARLCGDRWNGGWRPISTKQ